MHKKSIIDQTINFVQKELEGAEAGHDWWHIRRVWTNAKHIAKSEEVDEFVVELGALLHDIADSKFHEGDEEIGPKKARAFLKSISVEDNIVDKVEYIIRNISFKGGHNENASLSNELAVVQDADRLDAIGAIGVARTFHYGGYKNNELYHPDIKPRTSMSVEEYRKGKSTTINHFYEKLLLLKDKMNTVTAKKMAESRHKYLENFLEQFLYEWNLGE